MHVLGSFAQLRDPVLGVLKQHDVAGVKMHPHVWTLKMIDKRDHLARRHQVAIEEDIFDVQMIWWESFFSRHLEDDWIAVVFETQKQGLEFLAGNAYAYNNQMQSVTWSLDWVLPQMVKTLGSKVTHVAKKPIFLPPLNPEQTKEE